MILLFRDKKHCSHPVHGSHNTIHKFKNYFATVFSVFSFSNNKFNPNRPIMNFDARAKIVKLATKFIEYIEDFDA